MASQKNNEFVFYSDKLNYKTVQGKKGPEYWIEGYVSTGDIDLVNDIVTKNCMESMLTQFDMRSIKLDFEHETFRGKDDMDAEINKTRLPLGKAMNKDKDSKGVKVAWKLNDTWKKFDEKGNVVMDFKEIWKNVEEEYYDAFSIAYVPTKTAIIERDGKTIRLLDDINLLNVALTGNPINPMATMTSVMAKSLEFLKDQENNPADMTLMEVKSQVDSLCTEVSNIKKQMGCKSMVDKKDEVPAEDAQTPPSPEGEGSEQTEAGSKEGAEGGNAEAPAEGGEAEGKSTEMKDLKATVETLSKDVKALQKENANLKAIVEKPLHKAKGASSNEQKSQSQEQSEMIGPLDMV